MQPSASDDGSEAPLKRQRRHGVITAGKTVDHCTAEMPFDGGCYVTATIGRKRFRGILVEDSKLEELAAAATSPTPDLTFTSLLQQLAPQPFQFPIADSKKNSRPGRPRKNGPQTVVVVGAGLSGLTAAKELHSQGFRVIVLEARSEIGGRLRSGSLHPIQPIDGGQMTHDTTPTVEVDLGASWVHGVIDNPIAAVAREAGAPLVNTTANTIIRDVNGTPIPRDRDEFVEQLFNQMLDTISRGNTHPQNAQSVGTLLEELRQVHEDTQPLSDVERRLFQWHISNQEYATGADISNLSPLELSETIDFEGSHCMVQGGYRQLATFLAADLADIRLNSPVTSICYSNMVGGADEAITAEKRKPSSSCQVYVAGNEEPLLADAVLVTVPLGVLKASMIQFVPPLPDEVQQAVDRIGFGVINKIFLEFPWKFWGDSDQIGCASDDGQFFLFYDHFRVTGQPILMTLVPGTRGEQLEHMDEATVIQSVMQRLEGIFSDQQVPKPTKFYITKWRSEPYARGTYSYLTPGATWVDMQQLQQSVQGRLFFAGEATIPKYNASTHGAYMSGIERARMICEALRPSKRRSDHFTPRVPNLATVCDMCGEGPVDRTLGALVGAFHDGEETFFVHECCAVFSPEVTQQGGVWYNVAAAIRRGKKLACSGCKQRGATIGCNVRSCKKSYHVACAMKYTRWSFERGDQGKHFLCSEHRHRADDALATQATGSGATALQSPSLLQQPSMNQLNAFRMQSPPVWQGGVPVAGNTSLDVPATASRPSVLALMHAFFASSQPSPTSAQANAALPMPARFPPSAAYPHPGIPHRREPDQFQQHHPHQHQHPHPHPLPHELHDMQHHDPHLHYQLQHFAQMPMHPPHMGHDVTQAFGFVPHPHNGANSLVGPSTAVDTQPDGHHCHDGNQPTDGRYAVL